MTPSRQLDGAQRFALLKTALFFVLVPGTVAGYIPYQLLQRPALPALVNFGLFHWLAAVVMALGISGLLWCGWHFATEGRGTPAPFDPPKTLVVRGPYHWVRNPMYVSVITVLLGEAMFFRSIALLGYLALFWGIVNLFVMLYEEAALRDQFGESYNDYCRRVWRWIPRPPQQ